MFGAKRDLQGFLARRCSKEFLSLYLQNNPDFLDQVSEPGLFLDTVPEVRLAKRLYEVGLLPEEKRKKFVETVSEYVLDGQDGDALDDKGIRSLFTEGEFEDLVRRVRTELLPRLSDVRCEWETNYSPDDSPEGHMQQLLELFDSVKNQFGQEESAAELIDREMRKTREWIAENTPEGPERAPRKLGEVEAQGKLQSTRSIFDDVDLDEETKGG